MKRSALAALESTGNMHHFFKHILIFLSIHGLAIHQWSEEEILKMNDAEARH